MGQLIDLQLLDLDRLVLLRQPPISARPGVDSPVEGDAIQVMTLTVQEYSRSRSANGFKAVPAPLLLYKDNTYSSLTNLRVKRHYRAKAVRSLMIEHRDQGCGDLPTRSFVRLGAMSTVAVQNASSFREVTILPQFGSIASLPMI